MGRHRCKGHLPEGQVEAWCHDTNLKASKHVDINVREQGLQFPMYMLHSLVPHMYTYLQSKPALGFRLEVAVEEFHLGS